MRGWANYYRYCARAGRVFTDLDWYVGKRLWHWLRWKRPKAHGRGILQDHHLRSLRRPTRRLWRDGKAEQHLLAWTPRAGTATAGWRRLTSPRLLESWMHNERCTSGSVKGD
ncbi:hypothetical protein LJR258_004738 [Rhizobium sp. LjRoot258]